MKTERDPTTGAVVASIAIVIGLGIAILDMMADNLPLVLILIVVAASVFGAAAPRWSLLSGAFLGMMLPLAQVYVTRFDLNLPHPMHGFYFGVLAIGPSILSALFAMLIRDRIDAFREARRPRVTVEHRSPLTSRNRG
ncbi:MAG: hypothetical protein ABIP93_06590 [Gemmatimonadaceae bacterium]